MGGFIRHVRNVLTPRPHPPDIARHAKSRACYALGEASWTTVDQLSANTYLAALMLHLGFSDGVIGTVMSVSALVCVVQLLTLWLNQRFTGKRMIVTLTSLMRLWMALLFFVPFLPLDGTVKMVLFVVIFFVARALISFGGPAASEWVAQLTPIRIRGRYLASKDATAVSMQAITLLIAGMVLDKYTQTAPLTAFAILGGIIVVLCIMGLVAYLFTQDCKSPPAPKAVRPASMGKQIAACLSSRAFRIVMMVDILWQVTYYIACPYNASYSIKEMSLSFTFISMAGFMGSVARVFIARKMGAWADRTSMGKVLRYSVLLLGVHYLVWAVMRPEAAVVMYVVQTALAAFAWSFIGAGLFGIKLELMPEDGRQVQMAVTAAISGLIGFGASFLSGRLLAWLQTLSLSLEGIVIYPQQILNILGFLCVVVMCLYLKLVVEKAEHALHAQ